MASFLCRFALLLLSLLFTLTTAQTTSNASAVFVYNGDDNTEFVFALNADKSTGDLYFHLSSPAGNTWVGVGIGSAMKDALMFIAYPDGNSQGVTISPRIADGHSEPTYQSNLTIDKLSGVGLTGANTVSGSNGQTSNIIADGVCRSCASWAGGSINLEDTKQPFIFAVGPVFPQISSNSLSAGLSRHVFYGLFTMDMTAATSASGGAVPLATNTTKDASAAFNTHNDNDPAPHIHALVMSLVFIILLPLGSLVLRVWNKVKGHIIVQCIGLVLYCMAFAGGCVISVQYNRSKNFTSAHQIIGILLLLAMLSQTALGAINHRIFKREQRKTIFGKIHLFLGPGIILLGLVNGGLGLNLAGTPFLCIPYVVVVLFFIALYLCIRGGTYFFRKRRGDSKQLPEGYVYPQFGNQPPQYGGPGAGYPPPYVQQDVPLTRFASSHSVPRADEPAAQPRPMV